MKTELLILLLLIGTMSCTKTEYTDYPPELEIHVVNPDHEAISSALIELYQEKEDWDDQRNPVSTAYTNDTGTCVFPDLEAKNYYFFIQKDSLSNQYGIAGFEEALRPNEIRVLTITIENL